MPLALGSDLLIWRADAPPVPDGVVLVEAGHIVWAGPRADMPAFKGDWLQWRPPVLVPGLIDSHSHLSIRTPGDEVAQLQVSDAEIALRAAQYADKNLASGVVAMRLLGEPNHVEPLYRVTAQAAPHAWPVLESAGPAIRPSHARVSVADAVVETAEDAHMWAGRIAAAGHRWLKFHATPSSLTSDPTASLYSAEMIEIIVGAARATGLQIAVHCHGGPAADACIAAGVHSVEHGRWLNDTQLDAMASKNIALVTTLGIIAVASAETTDAEIEEILTSLVDVVRRARERNVRVVPGSDAVHGRLSLDLKALGAAGYSPAEVFYQSTVAAGAVCGFDNLGALEPGKSASIVGLCANPLDDVNAWDTVCGVLHGGRLVQHTVNRSSRHLRSHWL